MAQNNDPMGETNSTETAIPLNAKIGVIKQEFKKRSTKGCFIVSTSETKDQYTVKSYMREAQETDTKYAHMTTAEKERVFFQKLEKRQLLSANYAVDIECEGSDIDDVYDINSLPSLVDGIPSMNRGGVKNKYVYFGMFGSVFAFHLEDCKLLSVNVHRGGAIKVWYGIHYEDVDKFLHFVAEHFKNECNNCETGYLMHKRNFITPDALENAGIRYGRVEQDPGTIILTFPNGIHGGYNLGGNCNEARNIGTHFWLPYAKEGLKHSCEEKKKPQAGFSLSKVAVNSKFQ